MIRPRYYGDDHPVQTPDLTSVSSGRDSRRFTFIDGLRGIAAMCVACHHIDAYRPYPEPALSVVPHWGNVLLEHGWVGVPIFFVISGFVIAYSLRNAKLTPAFIGRYALSRWLRLAPAYIAVIVLAAAIEWLAPYLGIARPSQQALSVGRLVTHLAYVHQIFGYESLSAGFWTLAVEMQFYLGFVLLLSVAAWLAPSSSASRRSLFAGGNLLLVFFPLALASLFVFNVDETYENWLIYFFWMFFLGTSVWWVLDGKISASWFWLFFAAVILRLWLNYNLRGVVALATSAMILLAGRTDQLASWLNFRVVQYLGRVSYSIYLIHYLVNHLVVAFGFRLTGLGKGPEAAWLVISLAMSLCAAHVLYVLVERPSLRLAALVKEPSRRREHPEPCLSPLPASEA